MSNTIAPFIITLAKTANGYLFDSIEEHLKAPKKPKSALRTANQKNANRLIREIDINSETQKQEESVLVPAPVGPGQEVPPAELYNQLEEYDLSDCYISRQQQFEPIMPKWFDRDRASAWYQASLPYFFSNRPGKSPELYIKYRNFMLDAYQRNSKRYLTFTACRSVLRGDVCCLMRIYNFISSQNLINYGVSFDGNYAFRPSPTDKALQQCVRPQLGVARAPQASDNLKSKTVDSDNLTLTAISKHFTRIYRVYCSECKLICGVVWFAEVRNEERQKNICFECFNRMGLEKSNEYVKVDIIKRMYQNKYGRSPKTTWSIEDNMKLLDFMGSSSTHSKSWHDMLALFDNKRAIEDIIVQFMQFPITNYDPTQEDTALKSEEDAYHVTYDGQQHVHLSATQIQILQNLYDKSSYCSGKQYKEYEDVSQPEVTNFFNETTRLVLRKYSKKVYDLRAIENTISDSNLRVNEQSGLNRVGNWIDSWSKADKPISNLMEEFEVLN